LLQHGVIHLGEKITILLDKEIMEKIFEIRKETFISTQNNMSQSKIINTLLCVAFLGSQKIDSVQWSNIREYTKKKYHKKGRRKKNILQNVSIKTIIDELLKKE